MAPPSPVSPLYVRLLIAAYLGCAVLANSLVKTFGQAAMPITAVGMIPFELTSRDVLHTSWRSTGRANLSTRMALLIGTGSLLTVFVNAQATNVAIASATAFLFAGLVDTLVYELLAGRPLHVRMNLSNIASAVTDSVIFPVAAFGAASFSVRIALTQAILKVVGGALWTFFLVKVCQRKGTL